MISVVLTVAGAFLGVVAIGLLYLVAVAAWGYSRTRGVRYYGLPAAERARFTRVLRRHAVILSPLLRLLAWLKPLSLEGVSFRRAGVAFPRGTCTPASVERALGYRPSAEDVFVVTAMRAGTTWMQHLVYQLLHRGRGDLVAKGRALYAASPWLEAETSVAVADAPRLGTERPSRIIKTHLPAALCPRAAEARYIYVARHPVSCFASCADFIAANAGPFSPPLDEIEAWFCSDERMWWGAWPQHVRGWWDRAREEDNVLFVHFEEMKRDLAAVTGRVAAFLGLAPLSAAETARVVDQCGFDAMRRYRQAFEMLPPHILSASGDLMPRGTADRYRDVPDPMRRRISRWCAVHAARGTYPLERFYPDVGAAGTHA